jgi:Uma2 family endonuclease
MAVAYALEVPVDPHVDLDSQYHELCDRWPERRVEVINGRIVVNPMPTFAHACIVFELMFQLAGIAKERGWKVINEISIFLGPQSDRYRPDLVAVPRKPRMWGEDHIYADQTLLVVEVVSPSSVTDDHDVKPRKYAAAGAPLCLIVDPLDKKVRLLSEPGEKGYEKETEAVLGHPIDLPEPWELTLDTAQLTA